MREFNKHLSVAILAMSVLALGSPVARAQTAPENLPLEVRIDLLREQLAQHLRNDNNQGIVDLIPQFRALGLEIPDNLYFLEGRALNRLGRALEARDRLIIYLRNTGRDGTYYDEATELLLAVKEDAEIQERQREEAERERRAEQAQRAEKAKMLRVRGIQRLLAEVGFREVGMSGALDQATREALAVYQIRRGLTVNGEVTDEVASRLEAEVPKEHNCDGLARYSRTPQQYGMPISQISTQAAISACNEALRDYPAVIRFQVQYARALLSAGRNQEAMNELANAIDLKYPEAEHLVAWMHEDGRLSSNDRPDEEAALEWYQMAADKDYAPSLLAVGRFLYEGKGGARRDYDAAAVWINRAAKMGYPPAKVDFSNMLLAGRGVDRDYDEAFRWMSQAAESGYPEAQYQLGQLYERGRGVKRDRDTANSWYRKAANQGHEEAAREVR